MAERPICPNCEQAELETFYEQRSVPTNSCILFKSADEARNLKQYGELPETARINETSVDMAMTADTDDNDIGIDFDDI